jgi:hypothetical protein
LQLDLCGRETYYFAVRKGYTIETYTNNILRKIYGPNMGDVCGEL